MAKNDLKVLAYHQSIMIRLGLSSRNLSDPNEFYKSFMLYFTVLTLSINIILSGILMFRYWPNLDLLMEPITIIVAAFQGLGMYLSVGLNLDKVKKLFISLQECVDSASNYSNLNQRYS